MRGRKMGQNSIIRALNRLPIPPLPTRVANIMMDFFGLPSNDEWRHLIELTDPYTMVGRASRFTIMKLAEKLNERDVRGTFVECGVWRGGVSAILGKFAGSVTPARKIWLFDSFEGLPAPTPIDGSAATLYAGGRSDGELSSIGKCVSGLADVEKLLFSRIGISQEHVEIVKGWFQDTLQDYSGNPIALLHIDADWYESVLLCLSELYDFVSPGGYVVVDDYANWPGTTRAVDEFLANTKPRPKLRRRVRTQAYFQKN